jgi:hypothetical protein
VIWRFLLHLGCNWTATPIVAETCSSKNCMEKKRLFRKRN